MFNTKDKELRQELVSSGVIRNFSNDFIQGSPIGPRINELESKFQAICRLLDIEVIENSTVTPSHVAFKKDSPEARKHKKEKAARDLQERPIYFPWRA